MLSLILLLAVAATIAGGASPVVDHAVAKVGLWRVQAFRSGILIAVAFGDILPEAWRMAPKYAGWGALAAFAFCYASETLMPLDPCLESSSGGRHSHPLGYAAIAGLFLHSFFDGINLGAASFIGTTILAAVGTATVLHKLADGFTISTMLHGNSKLRHAGLAAIALATPIGAVFSSEIAHRLDASAFAVLLAFAGGSFVYIGSAEVLPRLHHREPGDASSLACFSAGLTAMLTMRWIVR